MKKAIVTGAGGFIGSHFVRYLKSKGYFVIGIDLKQPDFSSTAANEFVIADLRKEVVAMQSIREADELYMFAANMGGIGYIGKVHAPIMHDNVMINANSLQAAVNSGIQKVFFASSACVYPVSKQASDTVVHLKESDAHPAEPEEGYGWEKLFSEHLCSAYAREFGLKVRIARFHNVYGPEAAYKGGKEKAPAAICRKIARARKVDSIKVWGDGKQIRSYCYIDDCCEGTFRLMQSNYGHPLNIGSSEAVSINELVDLIASIAGKTIEKTYDRKKPQGVKSRNSDNTQIRKVLHWEPDTPLKKGLAMTYAWIYEMVNGKERLRRNRRTTTPKNNGMSRR